MIIISVIYFYNKFYKPIIFYMILLKMDYKLSRNQCRNNSVYTFIFNANV